MTTTWPDGEDPAEWRAPWDDPNFDQELYRHPDPLPEPEPDLDGYSSWWDWPGPMGGSWRD